MARPRSITDERLLAAAATVIGRCGPGFTLAQVAGEAGVAVGSVAQRFGSKRGLLCALSRAGTEGAVGRIREVARTAASPATGLRDALVGIYSGLGNATDATDATTVANHLGQLGADLGDPELRGLLGEHYAALEREVGALVRALTGPGWRGPAPDRAARLLLALANGAALDWSVRPRGGLVTRLEQDIDAVVGSWQE
ncbi:TetR/AcrR family transcriptional regulator [Qaidamihabitans albus]|uniref:TetR/AcrR family transcriptional regulator n=1 Tax=Qaidamihabitans albus TaxID=2795733 RepID=UPI0018F211E4|nr:TetR/AcrR family transcriptional regulator [Qaidamihabitans albus]